MARGYYYFVASLPVIQWGGKCPIPVEEFSASARRLLSPEDSALIGKLMDGQEDSFETQNGTVRAWSRFDRNFRNEIAAFRAQRLQKDPQKAVRGMKENEPHLREIVHEAFKIPDLLEAEKLIDRTRWQFLDELENGHYFDIDFLVCYALKLKILERYQEYYSPKGSGVFEGLRAMELPVNWAVPGI